MITVLGSINLDLVGHGARLPQPGETLTGNGFSTASGGKGANQALAALRAGARMLMVGAVGDDDFAAAALSELTAEGADLSGVQTIPGATGIALILVSDEGENVIMVIPGANGAIDATLAERTVENMAASDILVLQQEVPLDAVHAALKTAQRHGVETMLNIAPFDPRDAEIAPLADFLVANEHEFADLTGIELTDDALSRAMSDMAVRNGQTIIVTLGAKGAQAALPSGKTVFVAAPKITPVDAVGAGDTFCGYLAAGINEGLHIGDAMERAVRAASLACMKRGAQPAIPHLEDVLAFNP